MHSRQSGAAHVPIMFFLILLVLFLGALGFAYVTLTESNTVLDQNKLLEKRNKELEQKALLFTDYAQDVGAVFKVPGKYDGRTEIRGSGGYGTQTLADITGLTDPSALKHVFDTFSQQLEIPTYDSLEGLLSSANGKVEALKEKVKNAQTEMTNAQTELASVRDNFNKAKTEHHDKQEEFSKTIEQVRQDLTTQKDQVQTQLATTQQNLRDKIDEMDKVKTATTNEKKVLLGEMAKKEAQNASLVDKLRLKFPPSTPDGKVIAAEGAVGYISLGRKDMLQPGTVFRIQSPNSTKVKGYATVTKVEQERAEIALSGIADPIGDQVRSGDQLYNDLYSPNIRRNIYLMGRFDLPYNKGDVEKLLTKLGNTVVSKMGPGVDLVVLGNNPVNEAGDGFAEVKDSAEYKEAVNLGGVEFVTLPMIRDLIKM
jgi:hypothetical protein